MKNLLFGLAALPFLASVALAAKPLSDAQMDRVTAGQAPPMTTITFACPTCTGGEILTVSPTEPVFPALVAFLIQIGFQSH
jgi:hypothetical protein